MDNTQDFYEKGWRLSVGIVLFNSKKNIFMGERIDNKGAWQMPQVESSATKMNAY